MQRTVILFFATGAGAGYFPRFPGTIGTLAAIPLSLGVNLIASVSILLALFSLVTFILTALWFCQKGEEIFQKKDCQRIVMDEMAGFLLANFLAPSGLASAGTAFLLFRFFDIIKVFPAGRAQQMKGGAGVIADDLIAGLYT
ncbi:MAG: phosphatidylglycerophosphatase A family protein, partial [Candidatus Binatia bacterium]